MTTLTFEEQVNQKKKAIGILEKEIQSLYQIKLINELKSLFEVYPEVNKVQFTAYTPWWNDGEECTYRCHAEYCDFNGYLHQNGGDLSKGEGLDIYQDSQKEIYKQEPNPEWNPDLKFFKPKFIYKKHKNENYSPRAEEMVNAFVQTLTSIPHEEWKSIVGDHVFVTITPDSIIQEEYDHS